MTESSKLEVALLALRDELHTRLKAIDHLLSPYSAAGAEIAPVKRAYKKREPKLAKGGGQTACHIKAQSREFRTCAAQLSKVPSVEGLRGRAASPGHVR